MKKLQIGIIGFGAIGKEIARFSNSSLRDKVTLTAVYDTDTSRTLNAVNSAKKKIAVTSLEQLIKKSDLIIEAAQGSVVPMILKSAIKSKKNIMIMSIGGLIGNEQLLKQADKKGVKVYLPSGAIAGLDALKSAELSKIKSVTLTTKKPTRGLVGAPYLEKKKINLSKIKKETIVFSGNVKDAVKAFPKNINVSALLSLAGIGSSRTKVRIVASPDIKRNTHMVEIDGDFGKIQTITENAPFPENPKTSYLAALSAIATLRRIINNISIGT